MSRSRRSRDRNRNRAPLAAEATLQEWGSRGSALAEVENRQVMIDRAIPGERVLAMIDRRKRPWRGVTEQVSVASPHRVQPPCPYFLQGCGGCQWQHVHYGMQRESKLEMARLALERAGVTTGVDGIQRMEDPWRYRRTAALAIGWEAGFHPAGRRGIIEIHDCLIAHPFIGELADRLNRILRSGGLPNYHGKVWLDCSVVGSQAAPGLQILIQGIEGLTLESHPELPRVAAVLATLPHVRSVAFRSRSGEAMPLVGDLMGRIEIDGRWMNLPVGAFCQTNLQMVRLVLERMRQLIQARQLDHALAPRLRKVRHVADVYGGIGTFGLALAPFVDLVTLIELDEHAVQAARLTAAEWRQLNVRCLTAHAERALADLQDVDLAIVDPPRSGLAPPVIDTLAASTSRTICYVSCSVPSLARDLAGLAERGFGIDSVELFDFYPQTYHVEALAVLSR
ncbi:MAG: 23S rRNA (uracil(1939)-C(5))-methyltransferase RlmD [Chloroflexota bacterium]